MKKYLKNLLDWVNIFPSWLRKDEQVKRMAKRAEDTPPPLSRVPVNKLGESDASGQRETDWAFCLSSSNPQPTYPGSCTRANIAQALKHQVPSPLIEKLWQLEEKDALPAPGREKHPYHQDWGSMPRRTCPNQPIEITLIFPLVFPIYFLVTVLSFVAAQPKASLSCQIPQKYSSSH